MITGILSGVQDNLGETVLAIGALGTAAYGLVDVSKAAWGGISRAGFGHILKGLAPYGPALDLATGSDWPGMLRAHWLNGRAKDEQKAIARALIRLVSRPRPPPRWLWPPGSIPSPCQPWR